MMTSVEPDRIEIELEVLRSVAAWFYEKTRRVNGTIDTSDPNWMAHVSVKGRADALRDGRIGVTHTTYEHIAELEAAIDRVRALHSQHEDSILAPGRWCPACGHETPCGTLRALREPR